MNMPKIYITDKNLERLISLSESSNLETARKLEDELFRANIVAPKEIPNNVVTMNSKVLFSDVDTQELKEVTLVYPEKHNSSSNCISVLTPVGAALLGLRAGETIMWPLPVGRTRKLMVKEVLYQPEAAGSLED